jgi:hypothetical protein
MMLALEEITSNVADLTDINLFSGSKTHGRKSNVQTKHSHYISFFCFHLQHPLSAFDGPHCTGSGAS